MLLAVEVLDELDVASDVDTESVEADVESDSAVELSVVDPGPLDVVASVDAAESVVVPVASVVDDVDAESVVLLAVAGSVELDVASDVDAESVDAVDASVDADVEFN